MNSRTESIQIKIQEGVPCCSLAEKLKNQHLKKHGLFIKNVKQVLKRSEDLSIRPSFVSRCLAYLFFKFVRHYFVGIERRHQQ